MLTNCKDELPNPHKIPLRNILGNLVCHDQDLRRLNTELRDLQQEFDNDLEKIEQRCADLRKPPAQRTIRILTISQQLVTMDEVNEYYKTKIANVEKERCEALEKARACMDALVNEKSKFKSFHEKTINYIKEVAIKSDDAVKIRMCEKDICEMQRLFVKEIAFIKKSESELMPLFNQLQGADLQAYCTKCCFKEYDWIPQGKGLCIVNELSDELKATMGPTLKTALAKFHVHQHSDPRVFLGAYLMNLVQNEEIIKEKLNLFSNL